MGLAVIVANGATGLWALAAHWVESIRHRTLWWAIAAAQVALFVQAGLGAVLVAEVEGEPPDLHYFYGFLTLIAVALLYSYRHQVEQWRFLLYGGGGLFVMGLAIRAHTLI